MKSVFFIPVYNQIYEFPTLLKELSETKLPCDTLLLVNDGSTDGTQDLIRDSGYPYIDIPKNIGIGHCFIRAIDWAIEHKYDILGVLAGNSKMLPKEMPRVLDPILAGEADYVTGSRFMPEGVSPNLPTFRRTSIPMVNILVKLLIGVSLTDTTCGYRAYRLDIFERAQFDWHAEWLHKYSFESYLYAKVLLDKNIRSIEVPITMRYPPKGTRYTKIKPFSGWWDILRPWVIARFDGKKFAPPLRSLDEYETEANRAVNE